MKESVAFSGSSFTKNVNRRYCLLGADGKTKVVASSRKVIHALLHFHFSVAVKSAVIHKEEFTQYGYLHLCLCFESSEVEHFSMCSVLQLDAIFFFFFSMDIISPDLDSFRAAAVGVGV